MEVQSADSDKAEPVPDWPGKTATDIPHRPPCSTLEMTACLPECAVTVVARVVEIRQKENKEQPDKSFVKAVLQDCNEDGEVYQADLMAWQPDFRETMRTALQPDGVYEISPVLVSSEQQSFSLKWIKKPIARSLHGTAEARMLENQRSTAARAIQNLSEQKKTGVGRPDPSTRSAKLVAASTLAEFIPENRPPEDDSRRRVGITMLDDPRHYRFWGGSLDVCGLLCLPQARCCLQPWRGNPPLLHWTFARE